ncbi:MAG: alpha/beta fold hydrolase [Defluviitaleaceae bacterium]|nr:alpha/beta fold hydrolase [Defluviitaleaceae bacterium]
MKKQSIKKITGAFLAIAVSFQASPINVFAEDIYTANIQAENRNIAQNAPIIVLPGIAGTEMRNPANSVLQLVWINILWHFQGHLEQLGLDREGIPLISTVHPVSTGYGANNTYQALLRHLRAEFGAERVHFWGYDWRLDNDYNAERLREFIDRLNAPTVNIIAHSMGGLIVARYIANGHGYRINTLITLGTPFLGAPRVPYIFATGNLVEVPLLPGPRNGVRNVSSHMLSAYQMLPFESPYRYIGVGQRTGMLWWSNLTWAPVANEREFIRDYLPMRGIENSQVPPLVRAGFLERAPRFIESTFMDGVHAVQTVNSHIIVGNNIPTLHTTIFNRNNEFIEYLSFTHGDGTVPMWSQNINNRVNTIPFNYEHTALARQPRVLSEISRLLNGLNATGGDILERDTPFVTISATNASNITINYNGETLSSTENEINTITNFGTMHFIGPDGETTLVALSAKNEHDVLITNTESGTMDYFIRFYDSNFEIIEERGFLNIPVNYDTIITTNTSEYETTLALTFGSGRGRARTTVVLQPNYIYNTELGLIQPTAE